MDPKVDTFGQVDIRDLAILGVEKVVFWTFSKLFWSCLGSVWALFLTLKGPLLGVFSAPKVDKWPKISILEVIYLPCELKIHPKVGPLRLKTKPKHFLNKSKTTLKKSRNRLFWPPKWSKMTPQIGKNEQNLDWKSQFSRSIIDLLSWKLTLKWTF